ncbi:hypothetical protein DPMN_085738 [Dreissena polymorpha]|uniref:Uncharacterized protein n=1 Tax=Dreissena polymorpha TaxID=45954 RepID=A0A9D3YGM1_DREPO|nr:hypothetical protein DPMN_085738 [Dreissena polymorpha]
MRTKTVTNQMEVAILRLRSVSELRYELRDQSPDDPGICRCLIVIDIVSSFRPIYCKHICVFLCIKCANVQISLRTS